MNAAGDTRLAVPLTEAKVECVDLTELRDVVVCVFNTARAMNAALNRASEWVEVSKKAVLTDREHADNPANGVVEGHDLRGADLIAFDADWSAARSSFEPVTEDDYVAKLDLERHFWDTFLRPLLAKKPDLVLLAVAAGTDVEGTLSHEILHAQYFRSAPMREVVARYWKKEVGEADKKAIRERLAKGYAVTDDEALLLNEFQAYVLMHRAADFELPEAAATHAAPLRKRLKKAGITPVEFRLEL